MTDIEKEELSVLIQKELEAKKALKEYAQSLWKKYESSGHIPKVVYNICNYA